MERKHDDLCYYVRKFVFPPSTDIGIIVVAILVVIVNGFALITVLRNYRRLRQRIYVFVISLGLADILGGAVFLIDALTRLIKATDEDTSGRDTFIYKSTQPYGSTFVMLYRDSKAFDNMEFLQGLKSGCIVLSVLNTALVTFALYKRTTSMGKHHEDFRNLDGSMGADGNPFLPAFDTMMRVLSIGNPAAANGMNKNMGSKSGHIVQKNGDLRKTSNASRVSYSSTQPEDHGSGTRKPQVYKSATESPTPGKGVKSSRSSSLGRFVQSGGRRVSHALRSRSVSGGVPSYVGRHSNSVMSKAATRCSLFLVWLAFVTICIVPLVLHRMGSSVFCSIGCHATKIWQLQNQSDSFQETEGLEMYVSNQSNTAENIRLASKPVAANYSTENNPACLPLDYDQVFPLQNQDEGKSQEEQNLMPKMPCSSCSSAFFPLSNSHQIFTVMVIVINWVWLVTSSARLLYLRKHSSNVFVRCSALWRFMFMIALFYFITLAPMVVWLICDFRTASSAMKSPLWYERVDYQNMGDYVGVLQSTYNVIDKDSSHLHPYLGAISVCFLMIHFAVTPSLYLVRLLGFRRIFSIN